MIKVIEGGFNAKKVKDDIVTWIRDWFQENGIDCNAIIGISGGTDSSVVAALCVEALGSDNVKGLLMPCGEQDDIQYSYFLCGWLGICFEVLNIFDAASAIIEQFPSNLKISKQTITNLPARIRMSALYAYSQSIGGRVANTSNLSEDWIGYSTRFGDSVGDFSPLSRFTKTEVKLIGKELGLNEELLNKVPADGLCNKTDEENFGFTYDVLDKYIRTGEIKDKKIKLIIDQMHVKNKFKLKPMPCYEYKVK